MMGNWDLARQAADQVNRVHLNIFVFSIRCVCSLSINCMLSVVLFAILLRLFFAGYLQNIEMI